MTPPVSGDLIDYAQLQKLGDKQDYTDAGSIFIVDYKRDDWKKLSVEKKKEIMMDIFDIAKMKENYLAIEMLYQIIQDLEERIRSLEEDKRNV